ncbi:MAG: aspartate carbamoyltransferase regulatory subunit [Rikenellaceae bacterium]|nr:aspartate carbamoyltransferase regulatory subunit [Rikenellaceae bacterium]
METKNLNVKAIENGTVIDHIPSEALFKIIHILELEKETNLITFGSNFESKRMGSKAIIKIANRYCADDEINKISIVAPMACVNTIKNYEVVDKRNVVVPESIEGFVKCANPACITNHEKITTKFLVRKKNDELNLRCRYCEKTTTQDNMVILK